MAPDPTILSDLIDKELPSNGTVPNRGQRPLEGDSLFIRDVRIIVRMTRGEREDIRRWARDRGMSTAAWVRDVIGLPQPERGRLETIE